MLCEQCQQRDATVHLTGSRNVSALSGDTGVEEARIVMFTFTKANFSILVFCGRSKPSVTDRRVRCGQEAWKMTQLANNSLEPLRWCVLFRG
jgi:hypothetical protein